MTMMKMVKMVMIMMMMMMIKMMLMMKFCCLSFSWSDEIWSSPEKRDWSSSWGSTVTHTYTHTYTLYILNNGLCCAQGSRTHILCLSVAQTASSPLPAHTLHRKCSHERSFYRTGISFHHNWMWFLLMRDFTAVSSQSLLIWHFSVQLSWQFDAPLSSGLQNTSVRHRQCVWSSGGTVGIQSWAVGLVFLIPLFYF